MTEIATGRDSGDRYLTWDAPYVLGSLTRDERVEYEAHLSGCPECRAGVAELAGLPGLLALVDPGTALAMIEPTEELPAPELLPRLTLEAARRRRRGRWVAVGSAIAAAAAAVAISVPVVASVTASHTPTGTEQVFAERAMQAVESSPVSASVKLIPYRGKTRVVMTCDYGPSDEQYSWKLTLLVHRADGQQEVLGEWPAGPGTELTIDRVVDTAPSGIASVEIKRVDTGRVLLTATI
ncbi:zf-HC2 domain-containing protein [Nocardia panacis]|uniref:Zf-HC2 domain-containing protein n=1 Tax=Nocardia panacis TaxID=2340916 RepID=A0A3A4L3C3_9NOCA|nr:zf-HC2 domain-containing protein [Nocardia panacis]RJO76843.1 zf-HC2 domain-containing protein [Nocardia panacis]